MIHKIFKTINRSTINVKGKKTNRMFYFTSVLGELYKKNIYFIDTNTITILSAKALHYTSSNSVNLMRMFITHRSDIKGF